MSNKYLRLDEDNVILDYGIGVVGSRFNGNVPDDFYATFGTGKYCFNGTVIVDNPNYVAPVPE